MPDFELHTHGSIVISSLFPLLLARVGSTLSDIYDASCEGPISQRRHGL